jgi:hypothetical protein
MEERQLGRRERKRKLQGVVSTASSLAWGWRLVGIDRSCDESIPSCVFENLGCTLVNRTWTRSAPYNMECYESANAQHRSEYMRELEVSQSG